MPATSLPTPPNPQVSSTPSVVGNQVVQTADDQAFDLPAEVKLDLALQAIDEASQQAVGVIAQPAINQLAQDQAPPVSARGGKERSGATSLEVVVDTGGLGAVEHEPTPEIPPEVEEYVKRVEDHAETLSQPIVVDGQQVGSVSSHHPTQPVVVLPITEDDEKKAKFKSPKHSIRWLVEWSHKIVKKFVGKVIYRVEDWR